MIQNNSKRIKDIDQNHKTSIIGWEQFILVAVSVLCIYQCQSEPNFTTAGEAKGTGFSFHAFLANRRLSLLTIKH